MKTWKRDIFLRAIKQRMKEEEETAEKILAGYPALTAGEKQKILAVLEKR